MVNDITQTREELGAAINDAGIDKVFYTAPNKVNTACAVVLPADPYVTTDDTTFGTYMLHLRVILLGKQSANNQNVSESLDSMITSVLNSLDAGWMITEIPNPTLYEFPDGDRLGVEFVVKTLIRKEHQ